MKRYLLVGIALLFVSANASLKEDFLQMDLAEEQLLNDMRKSAALSGEDDNDNEEVKEDAAVPKPAVEQEKTVVADPPAENDVDMADSVAAVTNELDSVVNEDDSEERTEDIREKAMAEVKEKDETQQVSEEKAEVLKAEIAAKEAEIKEAKDAENKEAQAAAEQREVEAYEKQRAEKLAKEEADKAALQAELEKKQLAQKALDEEASKQKSMEKTSVEETKNTDPVTPTEEVDTAVGDVNVSRELEEKTQAANIEYEDAINEMNEED